MNVQQAIHEANQHHRAGRMVEAENLYRQVLAHEPDNPDALHMLGMLAAQSGHIVDAERLIRRAVELQPQRAQLHGNLGIVLSSAGKCDEAIAEYREALRLRPEYALVFSNMGAVLKVLGKLEESRDACRRAVELRPDLAEAHYNLGNALTELRDPAAGIASYRRAIELDPGIPQYWNNLGNALKAVGQIDEAIAAARKVLQIDPAHISAHCNLIYALYSHPDSTPENILHEQKLWDDRFAAPASAEIRPHANDRSPDRRLKIGYVSCDFREHVVGWNLLPILERHDHRNFEIFCYAGDVRADEMTEKLRAAADHWRDGSKLDDPAMARLVRQDRIDILIDLALHSAGNRLLTFARKPAPVQISYLGYCGGAGLSAIDYRLSDPYLDNAETERDYREQTLYLPSTYWCYRPGGATPEPAEPPALAGGAITFGCLNNFSKVSASAQKLFSVILARVKNSRLLLHVPPGEHLRPVRQRFAENGVDPDRLEFLATQKYGPYMQSYARIDIALDPFPYGGAITTCDALWMGVPVVSLIGKTSVGRSGKSILSNIGHSEWIAADPGQYTDIAAGLAGDVDRLRDLRTRLREEMLHSPLMDAPRFARDLEEVFRKAWRRWCANGGTGA